MTVAEIAKPAPYPGIKPAKLAASRPDNATRADSVAAKISTIRKGVPSKTFAETAKRIGLAQAELAKKLGLSPRTMASRLASRGAKLTPEESEKTLRILQIFEQAVRVFGSEDEAREWLMSPAYGLEEQRPIDLL